MLVLPLLYPRRFACCDTVRGTVHPNPACHVLFLEQSARVGRQALTKEHLAEVCGFAGSLELVIVHLGVGGSKVGPKPLRRFLCHLHPDLFRASNRERRQSWRRLVGLKVMHRTYTPNGEQNFWLLMPAWKQSSVHLPLEGPEVDVTRGPWSR